MMNGKVYYGSVKKKRTSLKRLKVGSVAQTRVTAPRPVFETMCVRVPGKLPMPC
jgi:hypothetical protein